MKKHDITIKVTLDENEYKQYNRYIDKALDLILPYGKDVELNEVEYEEDEE